MVLETIKMSVYLQRIQVVTIAGMVLSVLSLHLPNNRPDMHRGTDALLDERVNAFK